jgi:hypothetical protein
VAQKVIGNTGDKVTGMQQGGLQFFTWPPTEWPDFVVSEDPKTVDLDTTYPALVPGGLVVLTKAGQSAVFVIDGVQDTSRSDFALSARVTALTLQTSMSSAYAGSTPREVSVLAGSEQLSLVGAPLAAPVEGKVIQLGGPVTNLPAGRAVLAVGQSPIMRVESASLVLTTSSGGQQNLEVGDELTITGPATSVGSSSVWPVQHGADTGTVAVSPGSVTFLSGATGSAPVVELAYVDHQDGLTLQLQQSLHGSFDRSTVRFAANVAPATHGETKREILGNGDASATFQSFTLAQAPLTYVSSTTSGVTSTLQIWIDGTRWREVGSLFGSSPKDRVYTVRIADDDKVTVGFGDGITGARLPTGTQNVSAVYRVGTGSAGLVDAGQLSMLMTRPLGVRGVSNPQAPTLAADPDPPELVRRNAPRTALAFDRVVSLLDFEDFVRAIPGYAKAQAAELLVNGTYAVHLTVAADGGGAVTDADRADLLATIQSNGDQRLLVAIDSAELILFYVALTVVVAPDRAPGAVIDAVRAALLAQFGFDGRDLGQPVTATEVMAAAQGVPGVVAVNLTLLDTTPGGGRQSILAARGARGDGKTVAPAQLLTVAGDGITVVAST